MDEKFRSRKWQITLFIQLSATIGLFIGKLTGADFATVSSAVIVSYSAANALDNFVENRQPRPPSVAPAK